MRGLVAWFVVALSTGLVACAPDRELPGSPGHQGCENAGKRPLDEIFTAYFDEHAPTGCTTSGCHGTGAGGLKFKTAAEFRAAVVNRPSAEAPTMMLVSPGDLANSYLFAKLHRTDRSPMPQGGPYLDDIQLAEVAGWICSGAPGPEGSGAADGGTPGGPDAGEEAPTITGFDPQSGLVATPVVITGTGFSAVASENAVAFNGVPAQVETASATSIITAVPAGATSGRITVTVAGHTGTSSGDFDVIVPSPVPQLESADPATVLAGAADTTIALSGSAFVTRSTAEWDGAAVATTFVDATKLTAVVPAAKVASAGDHTLTVTTPGPGGGTSAPFVIHVRNPVPSISSLSPTTAGAGSAAFAIQLSGSGFVSSSSVTLNGSAAATTFVSASSLSVQVPAAVVAAAGSVAVTVTNPAPGGGVSAPATLAVVNPLPTVTQVSPASAAAGTGALTLTIDGTGYLAASSVKLDGSPLATTFVTAAQLRADVPASLTASGAAHEVVVTNPAPGGGSSVPTRWSVDNPVPSIASLSPSTVPTNGAAFTVTIAGSGFVAASSVSFNGQPVPTTFVGPTGLTATIPTIANAGTYPVTVTNPAPGGGTSAASSLVASTSAGPSITGISPATAAANAGFPLTVSGAGFACSGTNSSVVLVGSSTLTPSSCSTTQLNVAVGALAAGSYTVKVRNGSSQTSNSASLSVVNPNPVPVIGSLSPASAAVGGPGLTLTVNGSNFVAGAVVSFNGVARDTTFVGAGQLTAAILSSDLANAGNFPVIVTNPSPGGGPGASVSFTVAQPNPVPSIASLTPASVAAGSGAVSVTIGGSSFVSGATASFDGAARPTTFVSSTQLTMSLTSADTQSGGTHSIVVTNPAPGGGPSSGFAFTVVAANPVPVASSLSPTGATAGSGAFTLTVSGSGFVSGSSVTWNGAVRPTTFVSASELTASISGADIAAAGSIEVRVTSPSPGGGTSGPLSFAVSNPAPVLSSVSPGTVTVGSAAFSLSVNGSGFVSSSVVQLDGSPRTTHYVNSTQVTADIASADVASTGSHAITVVNPAPGGGTSGAQPLTVASQPNPVPVVTQLSPCGTWVNSGAFTLTITGSSFVSGSTVSFNGTPLAATFVSATQVTASVPLSAISSAPANDAVPLVVSNPSPGGGPSATVYFGLAKAKSTLSGNVQSILTQSCATSACHSGSMPAAGLNLASGQSYAQLVGVSSTECTSRKLVLACGPLTTQSYLVAKIQGTDMCTGSQMPKGAPLSSAQRQTIVDWVAMGAQQ